LSQQADYPRAIDVLKDAIKAKPKDAGPYLQLAFIYAKYLRKSDQAVKYAKPGYRARRAEFRGVSAPLRNRSSSRPAAKSADRARSRANVKSDDPTFWIRLGKLYATIIFKSDSEPKPEELKRVNSFFDKAVANAGNDSAALKEVADYYAASQQIQEAIPCI